MKSKRVFQILILFLLLLYPLGIGQSVRASDQRDATIIDQQLINWDTSFGFASSRTYENWRFTLTDAHRLLVTATRHNGDLIPLIILLDVQGNELARGVNTVTRDLSAGDYSIQVQSQSGEGMYVLMVQAVTLDQPTASVAVSPARINFYQAATGTVSLNHVPAGGYSSVELSCRYDPSMVQLEDITVAGLFGADPVVAINDPDEGSFVVAIAGKGGTRATTDGTVMTFRVRAGGTWTGFMILRCTARVSQGDNQLLAIESVAAMLTVQGTNPTPTLAPPSCDKAEFIAHTNLPPGSVIAPGALFTKTWRLKNAGSCTWTPAYQIVFVRGDALNAVSPVSFPGWVAPGQIVDISLNMIAPPMPGAYHGEWILRNGSGTLFGTGPQWDQPWSVDITVAGATLTPSLTPTFTPAPSHSPTPLAPGGIAGKAYSGKVVVVTVFVRENIQAASVITGSDGVFSISSLPPGTYTVVAGSNGFLSASASVTVTPGTIITMPDINLPAGDLDANHVIDPFDALTIAMNYNGIYPTAADLNGDRIINVLDLELLAKNYRQTGPVPWQ